MNKKILAVFMCALLMPLSASALTNAEIQARIATLLAQISVLQQQIQTFNTTPTVTPVTPTTGNVSVNAPLSCPNITRVLGLGMSGSDVQGLQSYLARDRYLAQASVTGTFDIATENAVKQWQSEHGIVYSGTAQTTGYGLVGPRTRSLIALNCRAQQNSVQTTTGGTTGTGQLTCPIAPPPTTVCSTGWQAVTDNYGCTQSYKCVTSLSTNPSSCPTVSQPQCVAGASIQWNGNDSNGCSLGYICTFGGASNAIPQSVTAKYNELIPTYGNSMGVFLNKCTVGSDTKYLVTGSGGFAGVKYYYDASGNYLGTTSFQDVQPFTTGTPPFSEAQYQCATLQKRSGF